LNATPEPLADKVPGLPPGLAEVMDRLLAIKPQDRYQSAEEAAEALDRVGKIGPSRSTVAMPPSPRAQADSIAAPAAAPTPAAEPQPVVKVVERRVEVPVEPNYPAWFRQYARLVAANPNAGLAYLVAAALAAMLIGFVLGRIGA
jgi:serine/threonine-protein kinase